MVKYHIDQQYLGQTHCRGFCSPAPQRGVCCRTDELDRDCGTAAALTVAHRFDPAVPANYQKNISIK